VGGLLALVPMVGVVWAPTFAFAMIALLLEYLLAECWLGPVITMLQVRRFNKPKHLVLHTDASQVGHTNP
jgi:hypothetical protein